MNGGLCSARAELRSSGPAAGETIVAMPLWSVTPWPGEKLAMTCCVPGMGLASSITMPGMHVAVEDRLPGSVRVHGPEVVELHLAAIDIFPTHVEDAAIRQHPRGIIVLAAIGDPPNIAAVAVAAMEHAHLSHPAVYPAAAARGDENDPAVGQVGRLVVVELARRDLPQAGAVDVDFVEMVIIRAALAVSEQDLLAVVMDLRIADRSAVGVQKTVILALRTSNRQSLPTSGFPFPA